MSQTDQLNALFERDQIKRTDLATAMYVLWSLIIFLVLEVSDEVE